MIIKKFISKEEQKDIISWAENEPSFKPYFEPKVNNPKPYLADGRTPNYLHDPSTKVGEIVPNKAYIQDIDAGGLLASDAGIANYSNLNVQWRMNFAFGDSY